jgi:hypothetical protein
MKYLIGFILALIIFYCGYITGQRSVEPCSEVRERETIQSKRDTIKADTAIKKREFKPKLKKIKSINHRAYFANEIERDTAKILYVSRDSIVNEEVEIYVTDTAKGEIINKEIAYKIKVPLKIIDSVIVTRERIAEKSLPQSGIFIGIEAGIGNIYRIAPEIEYLTKKGYAYSYNFDVVNNIHSVGVKKRISF